MSQIYAEIAGNSKCKTADDSFAPARYTVSMNHTQEIPPEAQQYLQQGMALAQAGEYAQAVANFNRAIMFAPDHAQCYYQRGLAFAADGAQEEALRSFTKATEIDAGLVEAYGAIGTTLFKLGRHADALAHYDKAIALSPHTAFYYNAKGALLKLSRKLLHSGPEEALSCFEKATELDPHNGEAWSNVGHMLQELGRYGEALACYDKAIMLAPDLPTPKFNKSSLLLLQGNFREGWPLFEYRWKPQGIAPTKATGDLPTTRQQLNGRSVLLYGEQGIGDAIQFCRYATKVAELGAVVTLQVHSALVPLLATLKGPAQVVAHDSYTPYNDYQCLLMSLPRIFSTDADSIPADVPYLFADDARIAKWKTRLGPRDKKRVGLVWAGNPQHPRDYNRSIDFAMFAPLLNKGDIAFYSLQKGSDAPLAEHGIIDLTRDLRDFAETAALVSELDLVITVDTSVAHLAGALGKAVWILLPTAPDFRWLAAGNTSAWYPTVKLFRQKNPGDWAGVIAEVAAELRG